MGWLLIGDECEVYDLSYDVLQFGLCLRDQYYNGINPFNPSCHSGLVSVRVLLQHRGLWWIVFGIVDDCFEIDGDVHVIYLSLDSVVQIGVLPNDIFLEDRNCYLWGSDIPCGYCRYLMQRFPSKGQLIQGVLL